MPTVFNVNDGRSVVTSDEMWTHRKVRMVAADWFFGQKLGGGLDNDSGRAIVKVERQGNESSTPNSNQS